MPEVLTLEAAYTTSGPPPCPGFSRSVPIAAPLTFNSAYVFPDSGLTAPSWVGCYETPEKAGGAPGCNGCVTVPVWAAFTSDPAVIAFYGAGSVCAVLVLFTKACNDDPTVFPPDPAFVQGEGTCAETPTAINFLWVRGVTSFSDAQVTCDPFSASNSSATVRA